MKKGIILINIGLLFVIVGTAWQSFQMYDIRKENEVLKTRIDSMEAIITVDTLKVRYIKIRL